MLKNPYPGKFTPYLLDKKKTQSQKKKWFLSLDGRPILPRKKGAGFIVFEGLDGLGQSTQTALLRDFLIKKEYQIVLTKEPTKDSQAGKKIREVLDTFSSPEKRGRNFHAKFQALYAQDRKGHLKNKIIPALKKGKIIISDRYFFTSFAYGVAQGVSLRRLIQMNDKFLIPDLTFILRVSPKIYISRIKKRDKNTTFFEEMKHFEKANKIFQTFPKKFKNVNIINGEKPIEEVFCRVKALFHSKLSL